MSGPVDVAIVGAGPYGLSLGAHLHAAGVRFRQFGLPMQSWRAAMPRGMFLTSPGFAANLSDPGGTHTLAAFCAATGRDYADDCLPVPLETFVAYGTWFARRHVPDLHELTVTTLARTAGHYELTLCDGSRALAHQVVVAAGMQHFAYIPSLLATLPARVCTHSCAHPDLGVFSGAEVVVVGAGQSALESAALLHEGGATVTVLARAPALAWSPKAHWFSSARPSLFRLLPAAHRVRIARRAGGSCGTHWLRSRVEGRFPTLVGHSVRWAEPEPWGVRLGLRVGGGDITEITAEHVLAATGYRADLSRLTFLDRRLRSAVRTLAGTPEVGPDFQTSVPGLYFIGPAVASTFGPVMQSLPGADQAARAVTCWLTTGRGHRPRRAARRFRQAELGAPR